MSSHTWVLNHDYSFLASSVLFLTLISTHACCLDGFFHLNVLNLVCIWGYAGILNSDLPEGAHHLMVGLGWKLMAPLLSCTAKQRGVLSLLSSKEL